MALLGIDVEYEAFKLNVQHPKRQIIALKDQEAQMGPYVFERIFE